MFQSEYDNGNANANLDNEEILKEIFNEDTRMVSSIGEDFI